MKTTERHILENKMLTGRAYMECYNQVSGIVLRNICAKYDLEVLR